MNNNKEACLMHKTFMSYVFIMVALIKFQMLLVDYKLIVCTKKENFYFHATGLDKNAHIFCET